MQPDRPTQPQFPELADEDAVTIRLPRHLHARLEARATAAARPLEYFVAQYLIVNLNRDDRIPGRVRKDP